MLPYLQVLLYYFTWIPYKGLGAFSQARCQHVLLGKRQILSELVVSQLILCELVRCPENSCTRKRSDHSAQEPTVFRHFLRLFCVIYFAITCLEPCFYRVDWKESEVDADAGCSSCQNRANDVLKRKLLGWNKRVIFCWFIFRHYFLLLFATQNNLFI